MLELFFLLLPVAVAYGWYMGRRNLRQKQTSEQQQLSRDYFAGLNYLLSDESDKAVDLFISMLDVDDETIDTHLSLGSLFRKRGEVDRAIRIHQNLIARPSLLNEQRDLAMMELGKDFLAAGFYDRAEEIFLNLIQLDDHSEEAENQLISIYEMTKDWQKAIDIIRKLPRKRQQTLKPVLAHFYCQLAEEAKDNSTKIAQLKHALKQDASCGRAMLALLKLYLAERKLNEAGQLLDQLIEQVPSLMVDALEDAQTLAEFTDDQQSLKRRLSKAVENGAGASVIIALAKLLVNEGQIKSAESLILDNLYRHPTMRGFQYLMKLQLEQAEEGQAKESLAMLEKLVGQQIRSRPIYRCSECGFPSHTLYWHCPSCKNWGSIKHIKGLDGE